MKDLNGSVVEVRLPVRRIVVLVRVEVGAWVRLVNLAALPDRPVRALARVREYDLCSVCLKNAFALRRCIGGEAELHLVSSRRTDHCVCNPGIATGGVKNCLAGG